MVAVIKVCVLGAGTRYAEEEEKADVIIGCLGEVGVEEKGTFKYRKCSTGRVQLNIEH